jgi:DNA repair protein RadA/Sms
LAKTKTIFFCKNCGAESPKWIGKCPSCGEWNTYVEEIVGKKSHQKLPGLLERSTKPLPLKYSENSTPYVPTADHELNRVLGGGIVPGSLILLGGEPGIGKSTLSLQLAMAYKGKVLYVSGEESHHQISLRANRIGTIGDHCLVLPETNVEAILNQIDAEKPELLIIDSVQTLYTDQVESAPGSISQLRESVGLILRLVKTINLPVLLIGHITKDGAIAGPKVLEHMVDTVLQFEGDRNMAFRILRTLKNRFGSTAEIGIYEMHGDGLSAVPNPSEMLVFSDREESSGNAIAVTMEGNRPLLVEVQALVSGSSFGTPQRSATGYDGRRLNMLLAVLEKRLSLRMSDKDVFLNVVGGLKIQDPALDLAIVVAIISSFTDKIIPQNYCFAGEVGLGGEVRKVNRIEERVAEANRLGYRSFFASDYDRLRSKSHQMKLVMEKRLTDIFSKLFS